MTTRRNFLKGSRLARRPGVLRLRAADRGACAEGAGAPARDGQGQAHQDHRRACALLLPARRSISLGDEGRERLAAGEGHPGAFHRYAREAPRRRWTRWRSTWRFCRSIRSGTARSATRPRRSARSTTRSLPSCARRSRTASGLRVAADAVSRSRGADARDRDQEAGAEGRGDRRQRARRRFRRSEISSGAAEGRGARRRAVHPSAVHAAARASASRATAGSSNTIGNPLDTTIALQNLIFEGTLDKFPGLKILAAHGGGYLPSYAMRGDHACFVSPQNCNPDIKLKKKPSEYLNQLYFDAMVFSGEGAAPSRGAGRREPADARHRPSDPVGTASGRSRDGHADLRRGQDRRSSAGTPRSCSASRRTGSAERTTCCQRMAAAVAARVLLALGRMMLSP